MTIGQEILGSLFNLNKLLKSAVKNKRNVIFVEIGPKRSLQRYITETLGNDFTVIPSVQPDKDHETMLAIVLNCLSLGSKWTGKCSTKVLRPNQFPTLDTSLMM